MDSLLGLEIVAREPKRVDARRRDRQKKSSAGSTRTKKLNQRKLAHLGMPETARKRSQVGRRPPRLEDFGGSLAGTTTLERMLRVLEESDKDE